MNWLYEKKMKEGGVKAGPTMEPVAAGGGDEPSAFNMMEQVSFAKGFSYSGVDVDTSSQGAGGMSMPGTFSFLGGAASDGDRLSQDVPGGGTPAQNTQRRSKKEEMFDKQMEAYQRERESGMPRQGGGGGRL
jgi:hypothetical protein